jgi:hypothetical protein
MAMTGKYPLTTSKSKKAWNRRSSLMDADKFEKALNYELLSAKIGRYATLHLKFQNNESGMTPHSIFRFIFSFEGYLRLKNFFLCREGIVTL